MSAYACPEVTFTSVTVLTGFLCDTHDKFTQLHQSNPQNKNEKQKLAQFEHAPSQMRCPSNQAQDKKRPTNWHTLIKQHWRSLLPCMELSSTTKTGFRKIYPAQNYVCLRIRKSDDSVLCPRIARRKVSAEGRFCIGETTCTIIHTTEVYSLKACYRWAHKKRHVRTCL